jgi:hypothetical protein
MHTFDIGDFVTVFNCTLGGRFFIEGRAKITGYTSNVDEQYYVRFVGKNSQICSRFVDPAGQDDPEAFVSKLNNPTTEK